MTMPAARSQGRKFRSQKPSKRPAATQARSSAAAPVRLMPTELAMTACISFRKSSWPGLPRCGMPGDDHAVGELGPCRDPEAPVVEEGALAALGGEHLVAGRIVDEAGDQLAVAFERDRDGEERDAVQEVGGAVERIDDEAMGAVGALHLAVLLEQEAVARPRARQLLVQDLLGAGVGGGDEIGADL